MINQLILTGNLGNDPEIFFGSKAIQSHHFPWHSNQDAKKRMDQMCLL
jgi:hypothetical protein